MNEISQHTLIQTSKQHARAKQQSKTHFKRQQLVMHYTKENLELAVRIFTNKVSDHPNLKHNVQAENSPLHSIQQMLQNNPRTLLK